MLCYPETDLEVEMSSRVLYTFVAVALAGATAIANDTIVPRKAAPQVCQAQQACAPQAVGTLTIAEYPTQTAQIYGFSFGATNSTTSGTGSGGGAGKVTFSDLSLAKLPDGMSALLLQDVATGRHLKSVEITLKRGSGTETYRLTDVVAVSFQTSPETESVSFAFSRIELTVGGRTACFDVVTNTGC
jgi:type VI secretion system secreted protein Hcp